MIFFFNILESSVEKRNFVLYNTAMKIKSYKKIKNNSYQVFFEEKDSSVVLYDDIILKYNLLLKKELDEKELQQMIEENKSLTCYYKALKYITNKNRCKKEIREYLKRNQFSDQEILNTLLKMEERKLINDEAYLQAFIHDQIHLTNNGPGKIVKKLLALDFEEEQIKEYLACISNDIWQEKLKKIIEKKINTNKKEGIKKLKERILFSCMNEGFSKENIMAILDTIEIPKNNTILEKEALKLYNKLGKKYKEPELSYQTKGRLMNKGFLFEDIDSVLEDIKKSSL